MDGTPAYVSLLKAQPAPGQTVRKAAARALFRNYLLGMQVEGRVIVTGDQEFIAPCLGTVFAADGEETERNLMFSRISYRIGRSEIPVRIVPFMQIPQHALARIFERDLRPPDEVARAFMSNEFIGSVLNLHALGDPDLAENAFVIRFLGGFLTGTVRTFDQGDAAGDTKTLDVRTFLNASSKPDWVKRTGSEPFFFLSHADRRTKNSITGDIIDMLGSEERPGAPGSDPLLPGKSFPLQ
jgi:hypothetical protein